MYHKNSDIQDFFKINYISIIKSKQLVIPLRDLLSIQN